MDIWYCGSREIFLPQRYTIIRTGYKDFLCANLIEDNHRDREDARRLRRFSFVLLCAKLRASVVRTKLIMSAALRFEGINSVWYI
jgi:hypothetical protein